MEQRSNPSPYKLFLIAFATWQVYYFIPPIPIPLIGILTSYMTFYTLILLILRWFAKSHGRPELGTLRPVLGQGWRFRMAIGAALGFLSNLAARAVSLLLFRTSSSVYQPPSLTLLILYTLHIAILVVLHLIVSVSEEGIFRGYIMDELLKQDGYPKSLLLSSLLFAVYHINLIQPIITLSPQNLLAQLSATTGPLLFGLAAGYLYKATNQNLTAPIAYHFTFNLFREIL